MRSHVTRRELIGAGALGAAGLATNSLIAKALAAPSCGKLSDIQHIVILVQENRSFDHYFGAYKGVQGWQDPTAMTLTDGSGLKVYAQPGYPGGFSGDHLYPFRLDSYNNGECTNDINHSWAPSHDCWNGGKMDGFVSSHLSTNGPVNGALTMGYYNRADMDFYYALADAFTVCDRYHCSVLGPTDSNRLYSISGSLGADGTKGGPILSTSPTRIERYGKLSWTTMPEQLLAKGISWKVYGDPDGHFGDNVLPYFKQYLKKPRLLTQALVPSFPGTFQTDCSLGILPKVSWIVAPLLTSEHPPAPPIYGESVAKLVLDALTSNPKLWSKTALFITHDEHGGFFDHVPPPVAPPGTPGEFLTQSTLPADAGGVRGPIGLGFRVPMLVVSPFSRGGFVCSDTFDHTSPLRFIESRFGAEVPNLSAWRRSVTGDMTSAFNFAAVDNSVPALPSPSLVDNRVIGSTCATSAPFSLLTDTTNSLKSLESTLVATYPVTVNSAAPPQEPGAPVRPSGTVVC